MPDQFRTANPDWNDLRFLVELTRHGSLSSTARALGVTHATVSRRIAALEQASGRPLFKRQDGRFVPTGIGAQIAALAKDMEEPALAIARAFAGVTPAIAGPVRITATEMVATHLAMPIITELQQRHPGLELEVVASNENLSLARRDADIALRLGRPTSGDLFTRKLGDIAYFAYAATSHLSGQPESQRRYIGYYMTPPELPEVLALEAMAPPGSILFRTNNINVRIAAVVQGLGVGLLPKMIGEKLEGVERCEPKKPVLTRELWLVVHRDLRDVPRIRECVELLVKGVTKERRRIT